MATTASELLFTAKGNTKDAQKEFRDLKGEIKGTASAAEKEGTAGVGAFSNALNALGGPAGIAAIATTAIAGLGTAAVSAGVMLFNLSKQASEYGSAIFDASEKTGLSARSLSALQFAAEQSGTSMEAVVKSIAKFSKTVGDASDGLQTATRDLTAFGLTPQEAINDLEGSLGKVFKTILEAKSGTEQLILAQRAFGRSGADLLPLLKSFDGDLSELVKRATELGVTIDDDAARAADEFGDSLDTLTAQVRHVGYELGTIFMPIFTDAMQSMSDYLRDNKADWQFWGEFVTDVYRGASITIPALADMVAVHFGHIRTAIDVATLGLTYFIREMEIAGRSIQAWLLDPFNAQGMWSDYKDSKGGISAGLDYRGILSGRIGVGSGMLTTPAPSRGGGRGGGRSARDTSERDAARAAQEELREAERIERERLAMLRRSYSEETELFEAEAKKRLAVAEEFADANNRTEADMARYAEFIADQILEYRRSRLKAYMVAVGTGTDEYKRLQHDLSVLDEQIEAQRAEHAKNEQERIKKQTEDEIKLYEQRKQSWKEHIEYLKAVDEAADREQQRAYEERERLRVEKEQRDFNGIGGGVLGGLFGELGLSVENMLEPVNVMDGLGKMLAGTFHQVAGAVGEAVKAFVLFGGAGTSFRKFAAEMIAAVAQMAIVQALWEAAQGFAMLALSWFIPDPRYIKSATSHFTAAAMYAGIGGAAALAGRAIAGDSFQREAGGSAYGSAGSGASGQGSGEGQGQAYSGQEDVVIDAGRNAPGQAGLDITLNIKDRAGWFEDMFAVSIARNSRIRTLIQDTAAA